MDQHPLIPLDLLEHLERVYPRPLPVPGQNLDRMWEQVGQHKLVAELRREYERQRQGPILRPAP